MKHVKTLLSSNNVLLSHVTYRYRYVGDVLCLWESHQSLASEFLILLNSFLPYIKFTLEVGG